MIIIDSGRCTGCGACVEQCRQEAIRLVDGLAGIDQAKCTACEACLDACPVGAISSVSEPAVEGELVPAEAKKVAIRAQGQQVLVPRRGLAVLPWLGAALTFTAREIVPRLLDTALDVWDRRSARPVASAGDTISTPSTPTPRTGQPGLGRQHRFRNRGGR
jgi:NAD-dependent dihydropyrimidine dehydrogenase PreA subunit